MFSRSALALGLSPLGILGAHHYYLKRSNWGLIYTLTAGFCAIGKKLCVFSLEIKFSYALASHYAWHNTFGKWD